MSRIGKLPIPFSEKVSVKIDGRLVEVTGPNGTLSFEVHPAIHVRLDGATMICTPTDPTDHIQRALWGTMRSRLMNLVEGVTNGFSKQLEIQGVGYKMKKQGEDLQLEVGYSHPVLLPIPKGLDITVEGNQLTVRGADKGAVGQFAAEIRKTRKPEPYKGKGIRYQGEVVRRKAGKVVKGAE